MPVYMQFYWQSIIKLKSICSARILFLGSSRRFFQTSSPSLKIQIVGSCCVALLTDSLVIVINMKTLISTTALVLMLPMPLFVSRTEEMSNSVSKIGRNFKKYLVTSYPKPKIKYRDIIVICLSKDLIIRTVKK